MPLFDKPLPELQRYQGTNPRPADFDIYWEKALAEMLTVDPQVELRPNPALQSSRVECFDLFFNGVGGARVHAKYLRPRISERPVPAVLQFHGYGWHSGDWAEKLGFTQEGMCVAALDCRGQGGLSEDPGGAKGGTLRGHIVRGLDDPDPCKLYYRQVFLDTALLARIVAGFAEVDPSRLGCWGNSQGGGLALACAALAPEIKRVAAVHPFLCDYHRVWEMDLAKDAYEELRSYFRLFDPRHERAAEVFTKLGYIDVQHLAPRIRAETLMLTGLMDTICPPSTQFAAYNRITSPKMMLVYPDYEHVTMPGQLDALFGFLCKL